MIARPLEATQARNAEMWPPQPDDSWRASLRKYEKVGIRMCPWMSRGAIKNVNIMLANPPVTRVVKRETFPKKTVQNVSASPTNLGSNSALAVSRSQKTKAQITDIIGIPQIPNAVIPSPAQKPLFRPTGPP